MTKKNVAVTLGTKLQLDELKSQLGFRTLSETIAYLVSHYNVTWGDITKLQEIHYREAVQMMEGKLQTRKGVQANAGRREE